MFVMHTITDDHCSTVSRKNFTTVSAFISEPDSRAQCAALEDNVKEFGLTYFGMKDRRQGMEHSMNGLHLADRSRWIGIVHIIGPEQGFTVRVLHPPCIIHIG